MRYSEQKAAQVAAFFLAKAGGLLEILKLMKLMYLAERRSLAVYGEPMTGDRLCSMPHGPVLSETLDHINNFIESEPGGWESWISDREDRKLALRDPGDPISKLLLLSEADLEILEQTWDEFGQMTGPQLRKYTHDHCGEWEDPNGSPIPIPYARLFKCVGYDPETSNELETRIKRQRRIDLAFAQAS